MQETRQGPSARVKVVGQEPAQASGQGFAAPDQAENLIRGGKAIERSVPIASNDAGALAEAVQDYLQRTLTAQSVDTIRLEITPMPVNESEPNEDAADGRGQRPIASVQARVYGPCGFGLSKQLMENEIGRIVEGCIADESWTVQSEIIGLDVQIEPAPILAQYEELYKQPGHDRLGQDRGQLLSYPVMQTPDE